MKAFDTSTIIQPEKLFGRKDLLSRLTISAKRNDNVQIIGSRRFGKTCVLKCMETKLLKNSSIFPIYIDMKADAIRGTENVYRYLIAILVAQLFSAGVFTQKEVVNKVEIEPTDDWTDIYESLQNVSLVKTQKLFADLVNMFADMMGKNILFMFDEYEYMFRCGFDRPEGFMKLRNLSTSIYNNIRPFSFWIAGNLTWNAFCTSIGSGELNVINTEEHILSLTFDDFSAMWDYECQHIDDIEVRNELVKFKQKVYECSGGIPFYAKQIGTYYLKEKKFPTHHILTNYFKEIDNRLHPDQKKILNELRKTPKHFYQSDFITDLEIHGLIRYDIKTCKYFIPIGFYAEHLKAVQLNKTVQTPSPTLQRQVKEITDLIENINKTYHNKQNGKKEYMFIPVNDGASLENDLRIECTSKEKFAVFCSALYRIYLERSKGENAIGEKLPQKHRYSDFRKIVDTCRHTFGGGHEFDTFQAYPGQLSKVNVLKMLVNSENEPYKVEEFIELQNALLKKFIDELKAINEIIRK